MLFMQMLINDGQTSAIYEYVAKIVKKVQQTISNM